MSFKKWLENQVAGAGDDSVAVKMRKKRMAEFELFFEKCFKDKMDFGEKISILDLGGTYRYWDTVGFKYRDYCSITLLNVVAEQLPNAAWGGYFSVKGNATNMPQYDDKGFDLCFSNSVIEHVGDHKCQQSMADEMRRVGKHFYLQTPNYWFPFEPHYRLPFMQFLPVKVRAWFGLHWKMGYFKRVRSMDEAIETAEGIVLLKRAELQGLFYGVEVRNEKMGLLTKSFYLYG